MAESVTRPLFPAAEVARAGAGSSESTSAASDAPEIVADAEELVVSAKNKLTLRCGKASITLHANGKIVLRGEYILSDAEGVNRINGGRIELN